MAILSLQKLESWCGMEEVRLEVKLRKTKPREPVVLTKEELLGLLDRLEGQHRLAAELQDGGGLRLSEVVRLRVKDVDPAREQITVRCGKGDRDRTTVLPKRVKPVLQAATANAAKISEIKPLMDADGHRFSRNHRNPLLSAFIRGHPRSKDLIENSCWPE